MFGDIAHDQLRETVDDDEDNKNYGMVNTPNESTILNQQDQGGNDSTFSLQKMGLQDTGEASIAAYSSMPNTHSGKQDANQNEDSFKVEKRVPLTTKHGQLLDQSAGMLASQQIDQIQEPS